LLRLTELVAFRDDWIPKLKQKVVIGRDARISGGMVTNIVSGTLNGFSIWCNLILGLSTTTYRWSGCNCRNLPMEDLITASYNSERMECFEASDEKGEFVSAQDGADILEMLNQAIMTYASVTHLGHWLLIILICRSTFDNDFDLP